MFIGYITIKNFIPRLTMDCDKHKDCNSHDCNENEFDEIDLDLESKTLDLVHSRIKKIPSLANHKNLEEVYLRQNLIIDMEFIKDNQDIVTLDLYDNRIPRIGDLKKLRKLKYLDLAFNNIQELDPLKELKPEDGHGIEELYLSSNLISNVGNVFLNNPEAFSKLRILELGSNRLCSLEGICNLPSLEELYLGKNQIKNLNSNTKYVFGNLRILALSNNKIDSLDSLADYFPSLEELYLSHNQMKTLDFGALSKLGKTLSTLDISNNQIVKLDSKIKDLIHLEEFWANHNMLSSYEELEYIPKDHLKTIYLEGNPLETIHAPNYRTKIKLIFPKIQQIDAMLTNTQRIQ
jgi:protein phosphatase 1 regulatory subunit 7